MPFKTTALILSLALAHLATPLAADAQPSGKVPRIGYLMVIQ